jgi:hypothetical protein
MSDNKTQAILGEKMSDMFIEGSVLTLTADRVVAITMAFEALALYYEVNGKMTPVGLAAEVVSIARELAKALNIDPRLVEAATTYKGEPEVFRQTMSDLKQKLADDDAKSQ